MYHRQWLALGGLLVVVLLSAGCQGARPTATNPPDDRPAPTDSAELSLNDAPVRISGPYEHENLTVFLIHSDSQDRTDFLTLEEGLKDGRVTVTEKEQEQVSELLIDNRSDRPLFLPEGERLQGGKQDRIITTSLVIPPRSGKTPVRTLCVEQSRWTEGSRGRAFAATGAVALAPKSVRGAAKFETDQGNVWQTVQAQKRSAGDKLSTPNSNSSLNETLDSCQAQEVFDGYALVLSSVLDQHPDAVGMALLVNGRIEEVNVYPNHALLARLYPRLIQSYAFHATLLKGEEAKVSSVSAADIARFLKEGKEQSKRSEKIAAHTELQLRQLEGHKFECRTQYDGKVVHFQVMQKNGVSNDSARRLVCGNDW